MPESNKGRGDADREDSRMVRRLRDAPVTKILRNSRGETFNNRVVGLAKHCFCAKSLLVMMLKRLMYYSDFETQFLFACTRKYEVDYSCLHDLLGNVFTKTANSSVYFT